VLKIVENLWTVGVPPRSTLGALTALPQTPIAGGEGVFLPLGGLLPLSKNPTIDLGLRPRFSVSAASPAVFIPQFLEF